MLASRTLRIWDTLLYLLREHLFIYVDLSIATTHDCTSETCKNTLVRGNVTTINLG